MGNLYEKQCGQEVTSYLVDPFGILYGNNIVAEVSVWIITKQHEKKTVWVKAQADWGMPRLGMSFSGQAWKIGKREVREDKDIQRYREGDTNR